MKQILVIFPANNSNFYDEKTALFLLWIRSLKDFKRRSIQTVLETVGKTDRYVVFDLIRKMKWKFKIVTLERRIMILTPMLLSSRQWFRIWMNVSINWEIWWVVQLFNWIMFSTGGAALHSYLSNQKVLMKT